MELQTAQQLLVQKEKLAAIGKLSGSVAHDIRNPLGIISNSAYFLSHLEKGTLDKRLEKHIRIIESAVERANDIITDLLDFSKENKPNLRECSNNKVIKSVCETLKLPENISLEYELESSIQPFFIDRLQIERVLHNLVINGVQAMPEGGLLKISSKLVDSSVELEIRDSGTGIEAGHVDDIYEPLFTTKSKGVGLGLSIAKTFVEIHNGTIDVKSVAGESTTFTVTLPYKLELSGL